MVIRVSGCVYISPVVADDKCHLLCIKNLIKKPRHMQRGSDGAMHNAKDWRRIHGRKNMNNIFFLLFNFFLFSICIYFNNIVVWSLCLSLSYIKPFLHSLGP